MSQREEKLFVNNYSLDVYRHNAYEKRVVRIFLYIMLCVYIIFAVACSRMLWHNSYNLDMQMKRFDRVLWSTDIFQVGEKEVNVYSKI